ncbi:helix-turn-helix transcriptional regulator [Variovorax sp. 160MFSha2.1]|uniref:helix-turn-helix transcriptional regulator n=1 Tax=Variovorax sp. 160MFSha2.1 TaxID=3158367 RepID=UPI003AAA3975
MSEDAVNNGALKMTTKKKQPLEAANNPAALLRFETVSALVGLKRSAIYLRMDAGTFPRPIRLSSRCVRWRAGDIEDWLNSLK